MKIEKQIAKSLLALNESKTVESKIGFGKIVILNIRVSVELIWDGEMQKVK